MLVPVAAVLRVPMTRVLVVKMVAVADRLVPADFLGVNVPVLAFVLGAVPVVLLVHGIGTSSASRGQHRACRNWLVSVA